MLACSIGLHQGWTLLVSGDVGGFGAESKFSWQAIGAVNYEFARYGSIWSGVYWL